MPKEVIESCTIRVPTVVPLSKNTDWILNLNNYRNAHYQTLNKAKVVFKETVSKAIQQLPEFKKIESIEYTLYRDSKRNCDVANVCSIVDKFFCDALVEYGKLPDDNYHYLKNLAYKWGGLTEEKSYVEIKLKGTLKMQLVSKITLDKADVISALRSFVIAAYPQMKEAVEQADIDLKDLTHVDINLDAGTQTKSVSSDRGNSGVSGTGSVQAKQPEHKPEEPAREPETEKSASVSGAEASTDTPAEGTGHSEAVAEKSEPAPKRRSLFARPKASAAGDDSVDGVVKPVNPDTESTNNSVDAVEQPETDAPAPLNIFGRKKAA